MSREEQACCFNIQPVTLCKKSYQLLALGDSIALSTSSSNTNGSYVDTFLYDWNQCYQSKMSLTNLATDGNTSTALCLSLSKPTVQDAIKLADIITINIGGNDIIDEYKSFTSPLQIFQRFQCIQQSFIRNMKTTLDTIYSINPKVLILVNGLYNPLPLFGFLSKIANNYLIRWNQCLKNLTLECSGIYIPTQSILAQCNKKIVLASDKIHLSTKGAQLLADTYLCIVRSCK